MAFVATGAIHTMVEWALRTRTVVKITLRTPIVVDKPMIHLLEGQKWRPKPAPPMSHPTNLTHIKMARTNKRAMNSALPGA